VSGDESGGQALPGKRLAYLSLETPREGQATHTHVHEIINGLRHAGWQVELVTTSRGGASSGSGYLTRGLDYVRAQWALAKGLSSVDAVFMRAHFMALPVALWARLRGKPVFQEINGLPDDIFVTYRWLRLAGALVKWSYRLQMRWAAHVFVVTEGLRGWALEQAGHGRVSVVTNGANTHVFSPDGPRPDAGGPYIAFVGGLTAWHGIGIMIAATNSPHWPEPVTLVIIGDGIERGQVEAAGANPRLRWLGRQPQQEAASWLRGALAALSITQDASGHLGTGVAPLKLFEAMASGVPVIVTDLPFQSEIVRGHDAGLVIAMADADGLAKAVATLAADPATAQRMGANGAAYVLAEASWQVRANLIAATMQDALGEGGRG
jgi:glycosyltransferase involved in cell wall biosynthesis